MQVINYTDARQNLKSVMDRAVEDREAIFISRQKGGNVVLMSEEEYRSWQETVYLLRTPANAERLMSSIEQHKAGKAKKRDLIDP
ncbi:type II toxin-antitoxin system Phd/YefM family antitoxin [Magnetofaba australis]|uniref:Antitoxin n=1 Tax=Magnetofaba australis IT-1 TaxID=1434232 RepID=A0A1Y2K8I3_9PROT|nr:type II toxin-antitoxin system prevent-host-death family antitoxin [Magnetofaba australis]OSM07033.1 putative antitoxin of the YoeB-YefM toxin-antitoxin system [Magnetofaba australis IT-1]